MAPPTKSHGTLYGIFSLAAWLVGFHPSTHSEVERPPKLRESQVPATTKGVGRAGKIPEEISIKI